MTAKEELEKLYQQHRGTPFPRSHPDKDVQEIHDRLIVYDAEIAGLVQRVLRGEPDAVGAMTEDSGLRRDIETLGKRRPDVAALLTTYLQNYDRLAEMVRLSRLLK